MVNFVYKLAVSTYASQGGYHQIRPVTSPSLSAYKYVGYGTAMQKGIMVTVKESAFDWQEARSANGKVGSSAEKMSTNVRLGVVSRQALTQPAKMNHFWHFQFSATRPPTTKLVYVVMAIGCCVASLVVAEV